MVVKPRKLEWNDHELGKTPGLFMYTIRCLKVGSRAHRSLSVRVQESLETSVRRQESLSGRKKKRENFTKSKNCIIPTIGHPYKIWGV